VKRDSTVAVIFWEISVAADVSVEPPKLTDQCALSSFVFRIECPHLRVQKVTEVGRCRAGAVLGCGAVFIEATSRFGLFARYAAPANFFRILQDAGLDRLVFAGRGHSLLRGGSLQLRKVMLMDPNLGCHQKVQHGAEEVFEQSFLREDHFDLPRYGIQRRNNFPPLILAR
jgi:hypothetical protein